MFPRYVVPLLSPLFLDTVVEVREAELEESDAVQISSRFSNLICELRGGEGRFLCTQMTCFPFIPLPE